MNPRYTFCREFLSHYWLWDLLWWHHCEISYIH